MSNRTIATVTFRPLATTDLEAAVALSSAADWPHRVADWALILGLSQGVVAVAEGQIVGTAIVTSFGRVAALNMIIVAAAMRGAGLGRALMQRVMDLATPEQWRLTSTTDGLPLYRKLGFVETCRIVQHQGPLAALTAPEDVGWAGEDEADAIAELDHAATGMDRAGLIAALAQFGRIAVIRDAAGLAGFAARRGFGRGEVVGPVVARTLADAQRLIAFLGDGKAGGFLRVDTQAGNGLSPWLTAAGLAQVGGGIAMAQGALATPVSEFHSFALAAQALG